MQADKKGQIQENLMRQNSQVRIWGDSHHQYIDYGRVSRSEGEESLSPFWDLLACGCLWDMHLEISRKDG